jgi:release factor glutamine methyltransferase
VDGKAVKLSSLVASVKDLLRNAGISAADVESDWIVSHVLGMPRSGLYLDPARDVSAGEEVLVRELAGRRSRREPLQYVLGRCEFMALPFAIPRGVFIPRPETEVLVEAIIERAQSMDEPVVRILDLGTGSGIVAVTLARLLNADFIVASDISQAAVEIARENAILNAVSDRVRVVAAEGLGFLSKEVDSGGPGFDLVACNPPYVETGQIAKLEPEVRDHDPRIAIDGGQDGFRFIEGILPEVPSIVREGGLVAFEIGATQAERARQIFGRSGMSRVEVLKDLSGRDRVIIGRME